MHRHRPPAMGISSGSARQNSASAAIELDRPVCPGSRIDTSSQLYADGARRHAAFLRVAGSEERCGDIGSAAPNSAVTGMATSPPPSAGMVRHLRGDAGIRCRRSPARSTGKAWRDLQRRRVARWRSFRLVEPDFKRIGRFRGACLDDTSRRRIPRWKAGPLRIAVSISRR